MLDNLSITKTFCLVFVNMKYMDTVFCNNLKNVRKDCNLTQKQVAKLLGVVESCYANWEQGRTEPSIDMLRKLSEVFKVSVDSLLGITEL